ncbi:hypothetical protein PJL15_03577 [Paenarthrobacter nitroguajacolicus]|nr:hypothetical protein [Paenarthrobacter nitroguajacolicus]
MDLGTTQRAKSLLDVADKASAQPEALLFRVDSKVVDPATMAVIARHGRPNNMPPVMGHYEKLGLHSELPLYIFSRIVPGADKATNTPKLDYGVLVSSDEAAKSNCGHSLFLGVVLGDSWWSGLTGARCKKYTDCRRDARRSHTGNGRLAVSDDSHHVPVVIKSSCR